MATSLKGRISSPLEAGQSIHDAHHLPNQAADVLEYVSKRLSRKAYHITLAVVRKDYQLPAGVALSPTSPASPALSSVFSSPPTSPDVMPSPSRLSFSNHASKLRSLVRSNRRHPVLANSVGYPSPAHPDTVSPRLKWPLTPGTPASLPSYPSTPGTPSTFPPTPRSVLDNAPPTPNTIFGTAPPTPRSPPFVNPLAAHPCPPWTPTTPGTPATPMTPAIPPTSMASIRFVYATMPSSRTEKAVNRAIEKAEAKFGITCLAPLSTYSFPADLLRRSIIQNEVLFSSEGVTLLSLDRLYTFKAAMASYTRSPTSFRLEDAVDELRRLVLASRRRGSCVIGGADEQGRISRSFLMRSYDFLGVSSIAFRSVERAYHRTYRSEASSDREISSVSISGNTLVDGDRKISTDTKEESEATTPTAEHPPVQAKHEAQPFIKSSSLKEPISPLKEPRAAPMNPSIRLRRQASPLPVVSIPSTPVERATQPNWEQKEPLPPRPEPVQMQQTRAPSPQPNPQDPSGDSPTDPSRFFHVPIIIPSNATLNLDHRPKPSALSPIEPSPINFPPPPQSPGKGPALKVRTTFDQVNLSPEQDANGVEGNSKGNSNQSMNQPGRLAPISAVSSEPIRPIALPAPQKPRPQVQVQPQQPKSERTPKTPRIKLDTSFALVTPARWNGGNTIDGMLCPTNDGEGAGAPWLSSAHPDRDSKTLGPTTPNGYEDISPITRGEWGMLMFGDGIKARTAAVETC